MTTPTPTQHTEPRHVVMFSGDNPVIIALDTTASMQAINPAFGTQTPTGKTRYQYATARIDELLQRLPRDTRVTLLTFDREVAEIGAEITGTQARGALQIVGNAGGAESNHGRVLEHVLGSHWNARRAGSRLEVMPEATLVFVTDGTPDDLWRYEAFLREALRTSVVGAVVVLWVGDDAAGDTRAFEWFGAYGEDGDEAFKGRVTLVPLGEDTEIRLSTRTASDKPQAARAPTVPPSLSPPKPDASIRDRIAAEAAKPEHGNPGYAFNHQGDAEALTREESKAVADETRKAYDDDPDHGTPADAKVPLERVPDHGTPADAEAPLERDPDHGTEYVEPVKHAPAPSSPNTPKSSTSHTDIKAKTSHSKAPKHR